MDIERLDAITDATTLFLRKPEIIEAMRAMHKVCKAADNLSKAEGWQMKQYWEELDNALDEYKQITGE